jgi:DNA-binding SARP family transcriptional activator
VLNKSPLILEVRHVWVDVFAFQRLLGKAEKLLKDRKAEVSGGVQYIEPLPDTDKLLIERITAMYHGPFLRDISEQWAISSRERLKNRCLYILSEIAQRFEQSQDWQKVIQCCEKCIEIDAISEESYRRLITVYNKLGRKSEGLAVYKRCKEALNLHLSISPSQETEAIHKSLRS